MRIIALAALSLALAGCSSEEQADVSIAHGNPGGGTVTEHDPGDLVVDAPARGSFIRRTADGLVTVSGSGATSALTIDGHGLEPASDGTFATAIAPDTGVHVVHVVDGDRSIDVPFLYGDFANAAHTIPKAIALRVNQPGFDDADTSVLSLGLLAQRALEDVDVFSSIEGQTLSGDIAGANWDFTVGSTYYDVGPISFDALADGLYFDVKLLNVEIDGELSVTVFGVGPSGGVALRADAVELSGTVTMGFDPATGSVTATMPDVQTDLQNFTYDSGNAGFPCCVDSIMTDILAPKVQSAAQDHVQQALPQSIAVSLSQFSLPSSLDLASAGIPASVAVDAALDSASFDDHGATLTTAVALHHDFGPNDIGTGSPGWLTVATDPASFDTAPAFGVSVSIDALNQALYAVWGQDGLATTIDNVPIVGTIALSPRLPPVILPNGAGGLTASAGEVVLDAMLGGNPVQAAITVIGDVDVAIDPSGQSIILTPGPMPAISITWLHADGVSDSLRAIVEDQIQKKVPSLLSPITLPLPTLPLGSIASSFGASVGALGPGTSIAIDGSTARASLYGDLVVVP